MRPHLPLFVAAAATVLGSAPAHAGLGDQLLKLVSNDGSTGDYFGFSIAIDTGVVAVGARHDGDNGVHSGSAYLFDASTGAQIAKLLPIDGAVSIVNHAPDALK